MAKTVRLQDLVEIIRSKNAGPFRYTFDMIFKDVETYERVKKTGIINRELIAKLYHIPVDQVVNFVEFDPAKAVKATIIRPIESGSVGDTDVYGAQQHAPLLSIEIPWDEPKATTDYATLFNPGFTLNPFKTALVVVDMQYATGCRTTGLGKMLKDMGKEELGRYRFDRIEQVVMPKIRRLLHFFRSHGLRIIYLTVGSELPDYSDLPAQSKPLARAVSNTRGNRNHEILEEIKPSEGELVLNKTTMSAFMSSSIDTALRAAGIEYLLLTGISTNSCVEATARDAADIGYHCVVVEDACGAASQRFHDASCENFRRLLGRVETVETVIQELEEVLKATGQPFPPP
jgi:nicotinamidase-related amidase